MKKFFKMADKPNQHTTYSAHLVNVLIFDLIWVGHCLYSIRLFREPQQISSRCLHATAPLETPLFLDWIQMYNSARIEALN